MQGGLVMWKSIKNKPQKEGLYVVAKFDGGTMVELSTDWACIEGYFGPNKASYWGSYDMTHWMTYAEYKKILEQLPKEE